MPREGIRRRGRRKPGGWVGVREPQERGAEEQLEALAHQGGFVGETCAPEAVRDRLLAAASGVDPTRIPEVLALPGGIAP